jgi:RNA polymerase sigma-70 factor (ECF subfamily)
LEQPGAPGSRPVDAEVRGRIRAFAFRLTGDPELSEDVAQETVARVLARGAPTDVPYLLRVALNLVRSSYRKAARRRTAAEPLDRVADPRALDPLQRMVSEEERARVWEALGRLPERERTALVLRFGEGLACSDVARVLEVTPNAVSCLLHRGKERMREILAPRSLS